MGDYTPLILMLRPRSGMQQWVAREAYTLSPSVPVEEYTDIFVCESAYNLDQYDYRQFIPLAH